MKRKTSELPTIVYTYGVRDPKDEAPIIDQMVKANRYYNRLIEIERTRREKDEALLQSDVELNALVSERSLLVDRLEQLRTAIKAKKSKTRKANPDSSSEKSEIAAIKTKLSELSKRATEVRRRVRESLADQRKAIREESFAAVRNARSESNTFWGTYLLVERSAEQAAKSINMPKFKRFDGSGLVAVQVQKGKKPEYMIDIPKISDEVWNMSRSEQRKHTLVPVRFRIGSNDNGTPIWSELVVRVHRPWPKDGVIKWAKLLRRRVGSGFHWELQLSVEHARPAAKAGLRSAAIDLGWRRIDDDKMRVGFLYDFFGNSKELLLPGDTSSALEHIESLMAIRDRNFNEIKAWFSSWRSSVTIPEWMAETAKSVHVWRSPRRMAKMVVFWRYNRFDGDAEGFDKLEAWRKQDKHLWDWEANGRDKILARRRNDYRVLAASLAETYDTIFLEKMDLSEFAQKPSPEEKDVPSGFRYARAVAALSEFREVLGNACSSRGTRLEFVDAKNTTKQCHLCFHINKFENPEELVQLCESCEESWDQDYNAARNVLRLGSTGESLSNVA